MIKINFCCLKNRSRRIDETLPKNTLDYTGREKDIFVEIRKVNCFVPEMSIAVQN